MTRRPPKEIGATQVPDIVSAELKWTEVLRLDSGFELERVRIAAAELREARANAGRIEAAQLEDVDLEEAKLPGLQLIDVEAERLAAANGFWGGATLRRVSLRGCRLTGLDLGEAHLEDVRLEGCKLDYANFRNSRVENVSFKECVLRGADFQGARLRGADFDDCELVEADFSRAELERVDFRGSQLALAGSVLGLRGAIIDSLQLMELSRPIAHELGLTVDDG